MTLGQTQNSIAQQDSLNALFAMLGGSAYPTGQGSGLEEDLALGTSPAFSNALAQAFVNQQQLIPQPNAVTTPLSQQPNFAINTLGNAYRQPAALSMNELTGLPPELVKASFAQKAQAEVLPQNITAEMLVAAQMAPQQVTLLPQLNTNSFVTPVVQSQNPFVKDVFVVPTSQMNVMPETIIPAQDFALLQSIAPDAQIEWGAIDVPAHILNQDLMTREIAPQAFTSEQSPLALKSLPEQFLVKDGNVVLPKMDNTILANNVTDKFSTQMPAQTVTTPNQLKGLVVSPEGAIATATLTRIQPQTEGNVVGGKMSEGLSTKKQDVLFNPYTDNTNNNVMMSGLENQGLADKDGRKEAEKDLMNSVEMMHGGQSSEKFVTLEEKPMVVQGGLKQVEGSTLVKAYSLANTLRHQGGGTAKIEINNAELGKVNLKVSVDADKRVFVEVASGNERLKHDLEKQVDKLKGSLEKQNLKLEAFDWRPEIAAQNTSTSASTSDHSQQKHHSNQSEWTNFRGNSSQQGFQGNSQAFERGFQQGNNSMNVAGLNSGFKMGGNTVAQPRMMNSFNNTTVQRNANGSLRVMA